MPDVTRTRFLEIKRIFVLAMSESPPRRPAILDAECGSDVELRRAVEELLEERPRAKGFLRRRSGAHSQIGDFAGTERFEVRRKLGSGAFGDVYDVFDRKLQSPVAVKILRQFSPAALYRFKREFRALEKISHPNLAQLFELIFDPQCGYWLLIMELVEGSQFLDYLRVSPDEAALRATFSQLARGVEALHDAGILHCDIKPSNVLITRQGRVALVDFGLAHRFGPKSRTRTLVFGTPDYAAPEQIAGGTVSTAADWYSVGVMLYRALSGRLPFEGNSWQVMTLKQTKGPELPDAGNPALEDLRQLCLRLLDHNPEQRPTGAEVMHALDPAVGQPVETKAKAQTALFIGRTEEFRDFAAGFQMSAKGRGVTVHVPGASGIGKTSFVQRAIEDIRRTGYPDLLTFTGKCYEGESVPYKALDEVVEELGRFLGAMSPAEIDALAPGSSLPLVAKLFPSLEPLALRARLRTSYIETADFHELRRRAFVAFRELLSRLAATRNIVIFIDDLQWGDQDSAMLLREAMDGPEAPAVLLVLAFREDHSASPCLQSLCGWSPRADVREIRIGPLTEQEAGELASHLLGDEEGDSAGEIAREAEGNPFFLRQIALHARKREHTWRLHELVRYRAEQLPQPAQRFLEVLAVARAPLKFAVLSEVAELGNQALPIRSLLAAESLIRSVGVQGEDCDIYHDRIAEAIAEAVPAERRRSYHEALALVLEARGYADAETVAQHFRAAGRMRDACRLGRLAAQQAAAALAFDRAARMYECVLDWNQNEPDRGERASLERARAEALVNCGRGVEAARAYQRALIGIRPEEGVLLRIRIAAELLRSGEVGEGTESLRQLLLQFDLSFPVGRARAIRQLLWERLRLRLRGLAAGGQRQLSDYETARLDVCWAAAAGFGMVDPLLTEVFCTVNCRLALEAGKPGRLATALASYATRLAYADDGEQFQARRLMTRAEEYAEQEPSPYTSGFLAQMWAILELMAGNWRRSQEHAQRSLELYRTRCTGVSWETATVISHLFSTRAALGDWRQNAAELPVLLQEARGRGDRFAEVTLALLTSSHAAYMIDDAPETAETLILQSLKSWPRQHFDLQSLYALIALVDLDLYRGQPARAWGRIEKSWRDVERSGLTRVTLLQVFAQDCRARAALGLAGLPDTPRSDREHLLRAARHSIGALEQCRPDYARGMALALRAGMAGVQHLRDEARQYLLRAEVKLDSAGLAPWLSLTRLRLAQLLEGDAARRKREEAMAWIESQQVRRPECLLRMIFPTL